MSEREPERGAKEVARDEFVLSLEAGAEQRRPTPEPRPREIPAGEFVATAEQDEPEIDETFLKKITASLEGGRQKGTVVLEKTASPAKWILLFAILGILVTGFVTKAYMTIRAYFEVNALWGVFAGAFWVIAAVAIGFLAARELLAYLNLRKFEALRELTDKATSQAELNPVDKHTFYNEMTRFCTHIDDYGKDIDKNALQAVRKRVDEEADPRELCALTSEKLLKELDDRVYAIITGEAFIVTGLVGISPLPVLDSVIVSLRGLRMIRRIAEAYRIRPGVAGNIRLLRKVFGTALYANLTQIAMTAFSTKLTGKVFQKVGVATVQGMTTGAMFLWVGLAVHREIRPVPFSDTYHQASMLRTLFQGMRKMLKRSGKEE